MHRYLYAPLWASSLVSDTAVFALRVEGRLALTVEAVGHAPTRAARGKVRLPREGATAPSSAPDRCPSHVALSFGPSRSDGRVGRLSRLRCSKAVCGLGCPFSVP